MLQPPLPFAPPLPHAAPVVDGDLAEQALPGHGIPSQDPDNGAQVALSQQETTREGKSVLTGGGMVAGAAMGAAIGVAAGGPVGVVVGAAVGAVAGALGGAATGAAADADARGSADSAPADAVRLHIEDSGGSGRPVLLIH